MKNFLLVFYFFLQVSIFADGISIEYVTMDYFGNIGDACRIIVEDINMESMRISAIRVENRNSENNVEHNRYQETFYNREYQSYPGEWTIVFDYWNRLPFSNLRENESYIAIPSGNRQQYIFLKDTDWNWYKVSLFSQDRNIADIFDSISTDEIIDFLTDPDLAIYAYNELISRELLDNSIVVEAIFNFKGDFSRFTMGGDIFNYHLESLDIEMQKEFIEEAIDKLNDSYIESVSVVLSDFFTSQRLQYQELFLDYCEIYFTYELTFEKSNSKLYELIFLYEHGTPLYEIKPNIILWAKMIPENNNYNYQRYALEYLFSKIDLLEQEQFLYDFSEIISGANRIEDHMGLISYIKIKLNSFGEDKRARVRGNILLKCPELTNMI